MCTTVYVIMLVLMKNSGVYNRVADKRCIASFSNESDALKMMSVYKYIDNFPVGILNIDYCTYISYDFEIIQLPVVTCEEIEELVHETENIKNLECAFKNSVSVKSSTRSINNSIYILNKYQEKYGEFIELIKTNLGV